MSNINKQTSDNIKIASGWMKFIAISSLIVLGIAFLFILFNMGDLLNVKNGILIITIAFIVIGFFIWYLNTLLQYALNLAKSTQGDDASMEIAFKKQKLFFMIWGILSILSIISTLGQAIVVASF